MKTRVLLINFREKEQETISKLGIGADLGYLSDTSVVVNYDGLEEKEVSFYSPYAIYDYKAIFIRLTETPPLESQFKSLAMPLGEKEKLTFLKYWHDNKGILVIFAEDGEFDSLEILGILHGGLVNSRGNDKTVYFSLETNKRPLRSVLKEIKSLITIPPKKYIKVEQFESKGSEKKWTIFPIYENRNNEEFGIYLNWGYSFSDTDVPAFLILPQFTNYSEVLIKLLKAFGRIFPKFFSEISDLEWTKNDKYYPKEISMVDKEIKKLVKETGTKTKKLQTKKANLKREYSYLRNLLNETGDKLKESVIKTLTEVFGLQAEDSDKSKKVNLGEDILIQNLSSPPILAEVKGTKNPYPSFTYVTQTLSNLLKQRDEYPDAIGGLILNFDRNKEPGERSSAYTKVDEEKQLDEIIFVDTRVLFDLSIAIIDHKMPVAEAKEILLQKGRINFKLNKYLKRIKNGKEKK